MEGTTALPIAQGVPVAQPSVPVAQPSLYPDPGNATAIPQAQPIVDVSDGQAQQPPPTAYVQPVAAQPQQLMPQASHPQVFVSITGMPLMTAAAKPHREYELKITAPNGVEHTIRARYSMLDAALSSFATPTAVWPRDLFSAFSDYTHNENNVRHRGAGLRAYLKALLNQDDGGGLVGNRSLHAALKIADGSQISGALLQVASERRAIAQAAAAAEAARLAAIAQQQRDDCAFAQTFNSTLAYTNLAPGMLSTIQFPRPMSFELRNKFWGWGDATLKGPGGHPWFKMNRTNPSLFGELFKNAHFCITTMAGEPLMVLQENFRWMNYEYDLFRVDPRTRMHVPVCRIVRKWTLFAITDQYEITHFNHFLTGHVLCQGRWPNQFALAANGVLSARVDKQLFSFTDKYHVHISPNTDVLLFLGIACAIDRIHHEVEDERERRNRRR